MPAQKKHLVIQLLEFAFANSARAKISGGIILVLLVILLFAPQIFAAAIGNATGALLVGFGPLIKVVIVGAILWGCLRKIGGFGK